MAQLEEVAEPRVEVIETVTEEPVTIYDPAYWEQDAQRLAALSEGYQGIRPQDLEPEQKDHLIGLLWREHWVDHQVSKALALRVGELATQLEALAPKPKAPRKARVPKAALPSLGSATVIGSMSDEA
jgi:hypothetical protein